MVRIALVLSCACGRIGFDANVEPDVSATCELPVGCTGNVIACGASCLVRCTNKMTWTRSRDVCLAWGGDLVTIDTVDKNACIAAGISAATVWIGLTEPTPGNWTWVDGSAATYRRWGDIDPDGVAYGGGTMNVDCARLNNDGNNRWYDEDCAHSYDFVCER